MFELDGSVTPFEATALQQTLSEVDFRDVGESPWLILRFLLVIWIDS